MPNRWAPSSCWASCKPLHGRRLSSNAGARLSPPPACAQVIDKRENARQRTQSLGYGFQTSSEVDPEFAARWAGAPAVRPPEEQAMTA